MHTLENKRFSSHSGSTRLFCLGTDVLILPNKNEPVGYTYFAKFIEKSAYKCMKYFLNPTISKTKKFEMYFLCNACTELMR